MFFVWICCFYVRIIHSFISFHSPLNCILFIFVYSLFVVETCVNLFVKLCCLFLWWPIFLYVSSNSLNGLVLNRCVSALPQSTCPFIPSRYLQQIKSRSTRETSAPIRFPDTFAALSQVSVQEPVMQCEERRLLGSQILNKKAQDYDSMLSRFAGNLIRLISNETSSQEVSWFCSSNDHLFILL